MALQIFKVNTTESETELFERIRKGDEKALEVIYRKYYRMMTKLVLKNNGTEDEARDVYQEALVVFWQKARSNEFELTAKMSTFIYSICHNLWLKELKRKKRLTNEQKELAIADNDFEKEEREKVIAKCLNELGETCRKVLMYYYFDDMSMQEIADKLGFANADTAKTKKYKCKEAFDELVKAKYSEKDFLD